MPIHNVIRACIACIYSDTVHPNARASAAQAHPTSSSAKPAMLQNISNWNAVGEFPALNEGIVASESSQGGLRHVLQPLRPTQESIQGLLTCTRQDRRQPPGRPTRRARSGGSSRGAFPSGGTRTGFPPQQTPRPEMPANRAILCFLLQVCVNVSMRLRGHTPGGGALATCAADKDGHSLLACNLLWHCRLADE